MVVSSIVWLIFFAIIILAIIKNGRRNTKRKNPANQKYTNTSYHMQAQTIPQERKEKPGTSYSRKSSGAGQTGRTSADKKSVSASRKSSAARSTVKNIDPPQQRRMNMEDIYDKNNIVAAAKANAREVELDNDFDASQARLLESVYDVMVKGPNDTISFQRDFLAEGLDMLNSFQSGNES